MFSVLVLLKWSLYVAATCVVIARVRYTRRSRLNWRVSVPVLLVTLAVLMELYAQQLGATLVALAVAGCGATLAVVTVDWGDMSKPSWHL